MIEESQQEDEKRVVKEKVLRLAPFFSFPLVSPHGPHPGRRATRELRGVKNFFGEAEKVEPLTSERGGVGPGGEVSWEEE